MFDLFIVQGTQLHTSIVYFLLRAGDSEFDLLSRCS